MSNTDPLLDDTIEFVHHLKKNGAEVDLCVFEGLTHGFVQFYMISNDAKKANDHIINWLQGEFSSKNL